MAVGRGGKVGGLLAGLSCINLHFRPTKQNFYLNIAMIVRRLYRPFVVRAYYKDTQWDPCSTDNPVPPLPPPTRNNIPIELLADTTTAMTINVDRRTDPRVSFIPYIGRFANVPPERPPSVIDCRREAPGTIGGKRPYPLIRH